VGLTEETSDFGKIQKEYEDLLKQNGLNDQNLEINELDGMIIFKVFI